MKRYQLQQTKNSTHNLPLFQTIQYKTIQSKTIQHKTQQLYNLRLEYIHAVPQLFERDSLHRIHHKNASQQLHRLRIGVHFLQFLRDRLESSPFEFPEQLVALVRDVERHFARQQKEQNHAQTPHVRLIRAETVSEALSRMTKIPPTSGAAYEHSPHTRDSPTTKPPSLETATACSNPAIFARISGIPGFSSEGFSWRNTVLAERLQW